MKNFNLVVFYLYLLLMVSASLLFYFFVYPDLMNPNALNQRVVSSANSPIIFFKSSGVIYRLLADISLDRFGTLVTTPIATSTDTGLMTANKEYLFFDRFSVKNESQIIAHRISDNTEKVIFSNQTPGLENYTRFSKIKAYNGTEDIYFLASSPTKDAVFSFNFKTSRLVNLTAKEDFVRINDFSFNPKTIQLAISSENQGKFYLSIIDLKIGKLIGEKVFDYRIGGLEWAQTEVFYLAESGLDNKMANLYVFEIGSGNAKPVTNLSDPFTIESFTVSDSGNFIALIESNNQTAEQNIFILNTVNLSLRQLTTDNKSYLPLFLPGTSQLVYCIKDDGVFKASLESDQRPVKILEFKQTINQMSSWNQS